MKNERTRQIQIRVGWRVAALAALLATSLFLALPPGGAHAAEPVLSDDSLYERAVTAYRENEWLDASRYLTAYIHRRPAVLELHADFAAEMEEALQYSLDAARAQMAGNSPRPIVVYPQVVATRPGGVHGQPLEISVGTVEGELVDETAHQYTEPFVDPDFNPDQTFEPLTESDPWMLAPVGPVASAPAPGEETSPGLLYAVPPEAAALSIWLPNPGATSAELNAMLQGVPSADMTPPALPDLERLQELQAH